MAVIGTNGTITSRAYERALKTINAQIKIESLACPPFVPLVEQGMCEGEEALTIVKQTLAPLKGKSFDTLILGCTHYPLLYDVIQQAVGDDIILISSGDETAREVSTLLYHNGLQFTSDREPEHIFYTTGSSEQFRTIANRWLDVKIDKVNPITLEAIS